MVRGDRMDMREMKMQNDEIELIDLLRVLFKRKIMISVITLLITVLSIAVCFVLPQKYSVTFLLELGQDEAGKALVSPQAVKAVVDNDSYGDSIRQQLSLDQQLGLKFKVQIPKGTDVLAVEYQTTRPEIGIAVLDKLQELIGLDVDSKLDKKKSEIVAAIDHATIDLDSLQGKIKLLYSQVEQVEGAIVDLQKARSAVLANPDRDAMAVLLYSNEIKDGFESLNLRKEQLKDYEKAALSGVVQIRELKGSLNYLRGVYAYKKPTVSDQPISPKKPLIVALGFMLGFMGSVMLAFLLEYLRQHKQDFD